MSCTEDAGPGPSKLSEPPTAVTLASPTIRGGPATRGDDNGCSISWSAVACGIVAWSPGRGAAAVSTPTLGYPNTAVDGMGATVAGGVGDEVTIGRTTGDDLGATGAADGKPLDTVTASEDPAVTPWAPPRAPSDAQLDKRNPRATTTPLAAFTPIGCTPHALGSPEDSELYAHKKFAPTHHPAQTHRTQCDQGPPPRSELPDLGTTERASTRQKRMLWWAVRGRRADCSRNDAAG